MSAGGEKRSAAAATADRVRAVLEAAEQSAAELRAEAAEEIEGRLARAQSVAERLSGRADEIERSLQALADRVRDELSALKADLEELRAVGEGMAEARTTAAETAAAEPAAAEPDTAPAPEPGSERPPQPPTEPRPEPRPLPPEEPPPAPPEPTAELASDQPTGEGHEGARVIALNMALGGSPRDETARYLAENFELEDPDALLDEVYARVGS